MGNMSFPTFLIVCPVAFFLGMLFMTFPYDYPILWTSAAAPPAHYDAVEAHYKLLHDAPNLIVRMVHIMVGLGLVGLISKLYKPSESNMLFDGGSLVLYMIAIIIYIANIIKGLKIVKAGVYGVGLEKLTPDQADNVAGSGHDSDSGDSVLGREDNLKVLAASNTILALVLVGVLVLQVGQWYAERSEEKARKEMEASIAADAALKAEKKEVKTDGPAVKRASSGKEGKKTK